MGSAGTTIGFSGRPILPGSFGGFSFATRAAFPVAISTNVRGQSPIRQLRAAGPSRIVHFGQRSMDLRKLIAGIRFELTTFWV